MANRPEHLSESPPFSDRPKGIIRVGRLDTIAGVRNELSRLYRAARRVAGNELDAHAAAKLAYLLNCIGRSLEASELERRLVVLEKNLQGRL